MMTGLGCDNQGKAISPNSDICFELDAELNNDDIKLVCIRSNAIFY